MDGLSNSDVALLSDRNDGMNGANGFFWIFALLLLAGGGFGGNRNYVTQADLAASQNGQTLSNLGIQVANNNYETAQLINAQTNQMLQQNNTNLINAIQGFNSLGLQITNQTNVLAQQIAQLSAQMNSCCCEIKTQMLQDRLSDTQAKLVTAQNAIDNANQSQYILGQLGRYVAWAGSGSPAATSGS
ncbi:MAG: hypothetical protein J6U54_18065 [Clostridiales bacterium]|nr:hypothetical protein [Clostridiales bacterium]